ncbi:hypothetical protein [Ereboglobus luteus]|uniref:hypothetical protein n=1 Tax=Ereboglobus luteus TaxID=1796921 RepID=UPI0012601A5C|nr:hypothetical protein [Ereboglobus luteus]
MTKTPVKILLFSLFVASGFCCGVFLGCKPATKHAPSDAASIIKAENEIIGLTEEALRRRFPDITEVSGSFSILVSKNLHPYQVPKNNKLLQFGTLYLVAELKDGRVIAIHKVSG